MQYIYVAYLVFEVIDSAITSARSNYQLATRYRVILLVLQVLTVTAIRPIFAIALIGVNLSDHIVMISSCRQCDKLYRL